MANGHGGARPGSGPKKKPLAEKIAEGNPGKRPLEVIAFPASDLTGAEMPPPREYLAAQQHGGGRTKAVELYESTWRWLRERNCDHLIPPQVPVQAPPLAQDGLVFTKNLPSLVAGSYTYRQLFLS